MPPEKTMISLFKTTAAELRELKVHPRQSYDEVLQILLREHKDRVQRGEGGG